MAFEIAHDIANNHMPRFWFIATTLPACVQVVLSLIYTCFFLFACAEVSRVFSVWSTHFGYYRKKENQEKMKNKFSSITLSIQIIVKPRPQIAWTHLNTKFYIFISFTPHLFLIIIY